MKSVQFFVEPSVVGMWDSDSVKDGDGLAISFKAVLVAIEGCPVKIFSTAIRKAKEKAVRHSDDQMPPDPLNHRIGVLSERQVKVSQNVVIPHE